MAPPHHREYMAKAVQAAVQAGRAILDVYHTDFEVENKADSSPLTLADKRSHQIIRTALKPFGLPLLSEEGRQIPWETRRNWETLWVVDPLDGTKEFVKRNDEFTVNIALVTDGTPIMGVIFVPVSGVLYLAHRDMGAFKTSAPDFADDRPGDELQPGLSAPAFLDDLLQGARRLPLAGKSRSVYTIAGSRSHATGELSRCVEEQRRRHGQVDFISAGSSLKFCLVAEGKADIYPRFGPTSEWDTAAGQAILACSGGTVVSQETGQALRYNKEDILNPWFVAAREKTG